MKEGNVLFKRNLNTNRYDKNWKIIQLRFVQKPKGLIQWMWFFWGFDIFIEKVPFLKFIVLLNVIMWIL